MKAYAYYPLRESLHYGLIFDETGIPKAAKSIPHTGRSKANLAKRPTNNIDKFADLLSEGLTVRQAANRLGFGYDYGNAMLQRIRRKLGGQAI